MLKTPLILLELEILKSELSSSYYCRIFDRDFKYYNCILEKSDSL